MVVRTSRTRRQGEVRLKTDLERELAEQLDLAREKNAELDRQRRELAQANRLLEELATKDALTELSNRRHGRAVLEAAFAFSLREQRPLSILMVDVDQFKSYNDAFGHPAGDDVLRAVSGLLVRGSRECDLAARYGGEEFLILLPAADSDAARTTAERLRASVAAFPWPLRTITASFGVATTTPASRNADELVAEADDALYHSKRRGRNRVTHHDDLAVVSPLGVASTSLLSSMNDFLVTFDVLPPTTGPRPEAEFPPRAGLTHAARPAGLPASGDADSPRQVARPPAVPVEGPDLSAVCEALIEAWLHALNLHDPASVTHSRRVMETTVLVARGMGLAEVDLVDIRRGALLHDIGKLGVPESILNKPGPLDDGEWQVMRRHPHYAHEILAPLGFLGAALDIPYCHHERWDGLGYPRGLSGEEIPILARICAAVDVWDALLFDRPYRAGWPEDRVREHLTSLAGTHLDPAVVATLLDAVTEPARA